MMTTMIKILMTTMKKPTCWPPTSQSPEMTTPLCPARDLKENWSKDKIGFKNAPFGFSDSTCESHLGQLLSQIWVNCCPKFGPIRVLKRFESLANTSFQKGIVGKVNK